MKTDGEQFSVLVAHPSADLYGSDRVLLETIEGLHRSGARVLVALPSSGPLVAELKRRGAAVILSPTPVLRKSLLTPAGLTKLAATSVHGLLRSIGVIRGARPDVILANTVTVPLWTAAGRLTGVPVVTHVHEAEANAPRALRAALALPLLLSRGILTNSQFSSDTLASALPALQARSRVLYNGVPGPAEPVPPRPDLQGGLRILYVGRLSHRKGVDVAIDALLRLRSDGVPARLSVVGAVFPGYEDYEAGLRNQVQAHGAEDHVTFHGFQNVVWPFLADADVVVVPSRLDEPFGNTAVEAVLASRPVIVSNTSGLREAAAGYRSAQFVEPGDPAELADALARVAGRWQHYQSSARLDAAEAGSRHSPERYGTLMTGYLAQAAGRLL
ncbi:Glycosyltransferase involved in cell wall bisynthesis [Arthrobacter sp. 49Tsu3.1M3]|jgi:glycosyltransferase involved in cell wall biosynthesis|uniref:glycosyltransferase family 4 protein n=1 Tax=Arthrobacter sp. 49Tsu3.1M3 TaxID=1279029 RepID=UPI0009A81B49|nr:glycosyltransferase family 4 protein [Arthrobacter sp. 49Tsu3.1M3]SKB61580.1 Glycosyltransferase involved in cell wall bisynthesis [Arthrobacter sp. 49Tsu3.1M3]